MNKLREIEQNENVRNLHAVESGSRAWGFASPDSDYDVRFIYVRSKDYYLRLDKTRDVIELPISEDLDINGWDLDKTLVLLHKSNPTLFEWFQSPITYIKTDFCETVQPYLREYFYSVKGLFHYLSMAKSNYREYLKGATVNAKKYFYVLRPLLACRWIMERNCPPPMLFAELVAAELPQELKPYIDNLLDIKMNSPEVKEIPKIQAINDFIEKEIECIASKINSTETEPSASWDDLNKLFLSEIEKYN